MLFADERVPQERAAGIPRPPAAGDRACPRAEGNRCALPVGILVPEGLQHGAPIVERGGHLESGLLQPVGANHRTHKRQQDGIAAQKWKDVDVALVGDDLFAPVRVIGEDLLEVGRVLVDQVVQSDDDAILDGLAWSTRV